MSFVLAAQNNWLTLTPNNDNDPLPFEPIPLQTFANLRNAVNSTPPHADFFMWEHFTSKKHHASNEIKKIGEIYTPWSSWKIVARDELVEDERLEEMFRAVDKGIEYFRGHGEESVESICTELDYEREDAREWLGTVEFARGVRGVEEGVVGRTIEVLRKAGVVKGEGVEAEGMIGIKRA
ncbi:MAG: hypothetical protein M1835_006786 [Candelina submexicana]|nr:MAG: hypothetical protein M1835_006786 [Candelina submexicana]